MKFINWFFGVLVLVIGIINSFWGNDPIYGISLVLLSLIYFTKITEVVAKKIGVKPLWLKIIVGFVILWTALGVAELFDKIELMMNDFN